MTETNDKRQRQHLLTDLLEFAELIFVRGLEQSRRPRVQVVDLAGVHVLEHVLHRLNVEVLDVHLLFLALLHVVDEHGLEDGRPGPQDDLVAH